MQYSPSETRKKKIPLHATPTDRSSSEVLGSAGSVSALWYIYARWDMLCGVVSSWPCNYCSGNYSTGNPPKGTKSPSLPPECRLVKTSRQNQRVGYQGLGVEATVFLRYGHPGCYICANPLSKWGDMVPWHCFPPARTYLPWINPRCAPWGLRGGCTGTAGEGGWVPKTAVERTEAPGKLSKALTWAPSGYFFW